MPVTSKQLVQAFFLGKTVVRPPFIPYIATAAAHFMQVPVKQLFSDPTTLANSLQACQRLFKYDGVVTLFDTTLEAEACGCDLAWPEGQPPAVVSHVLSGRRDVEGLEVSNVESKGRIPLVLEAARRLTQTIGRDVALWGAITGPLTLAKHLRGESIVALAEGDDQMFQKLIELWGKIALKLARTYGELKFDAVLLVDEELAGLSPARYAQIQPALKTLRNLVSFYDARVIIATRTLAAESLPALFQLPADGFSLGNPISTLTGLPGTTRMILGGCIPTPALLGTLQEVGTATQELREKSTTARLFITSEWEVPPATPASNLHKVMQILTGTAK